MRLTGVLLVVVGACGGDDLDAPDDCAAGEVHVVHGDTDARVMLGNLSFSNAFGGGSLGTLDIGDLGGNGGGDRVLVQFQTLLAHGEMVAARGAVKLGALDAGNCETGGFAGAIHQDDDGDGWRWSLVELHAPPYCGGAPIAGSLAGCYRTAN